MTSGALSVDQYFEEPPQRRISLTGTISPQPSVSYPTQAYSSVYTALPIRRASRVADLPSPQPHSLERVLPGLALSGKQAAHQIDSPEHVPLSPPSSRASLWDMSPTSADQQTWIRESTSGGSPLSAPDKSWTFPAAVESHEHLITVKAITPPPSLSPVLLPTKTNIKHRQPPKSDFALWVGNLPSRPCLQELCDVFASPDILSVYLIQRTGCAFVNFRTKAGLDTAVEMFYKRGGSIRDQKLMIKKKCEDDSKPSGSKNSKDSGNASPPSTADSPNRYFVCKSLSVADLETAKATCRWSTQMHNAARFNEAFHAAKNVYFLFSANRTASYFGYARMESPIPEEESPPPVCEPVEENTTTVTLTDAILDPETGEERCPPGEIVEDTKRGCLFWQVFDCPEEEAEQEQWTAPCKLKWLSNGTPLPFTQTKHLRNPLNDDKPVKIARDGTEIEPSVGAQLCSLFAS